MNQLKRVKLNGQAVKYIKQQLLLGNSLAHQLLKLQNLDSGNVITYLPQNVTAKRITNFNEPILKKPSKKMHRQIVAKDGSKWTVVPKPNMDESLVNLIIEYLAENKNKVCIFEDALLRSTDPWVTKADTHLVFYNNEVYHIILNHKSEKKQILQIIRRARSWLFIGVLTSIDMEAVQKQKKGFIAIDDIYILAKETKKIIIGAYDGEGYLIWNKNE